MTTVERVFSLIEANKLTAKEFAYICDLSPGNVTDWKTGRSKPSIEALKKISSAFNVNIEWLLGENTKKEKDNLDNSIEIPNDFKYYIEDLPEFIVYRVKFITFILLVPYSDFNNIDNEVESELSVYQIPQRFKKDTKRAILYLYNYNMQLIMDRNLFSLSNNSSKISSNSKLDSNYFMTPVYGRISAGQRNWAEECLEGYLPIDPNLMGIINPEEHFFLRVNGESMNKVIRNGAYALIHKQDVVENGEIAVVLVNGDEATLKKFSKQEDLVILEPMSDDSNFQVQVYNKTTPINILGKYVGKFEINK